MHIDVETKFEVGQEVFLIKKDRKVIENKEKCKICNGEGHIVFKGYTMSCPECEGSKYICVRWPWESLLMANTLTENLNPLQHPER